MQRHFWRSLESGDPEMIQQMARGWGSVTFIDLWRRIQTVVDKEASCFCARWRKQCGKLWQKC